MDSLDMEINEVMKKIEIPMNELPPETERFKEYEYVPIKKAVGKTINIEFAVFHINAGSFSLYGDNKRVYAMMWDNCCIPFEATVGEKCDKVYHDRNGGGFYIYYPGKPLKGKIHLEGKILKRYVLEILDE